jgi:hypothetical protein
LTSEVELVAASYLKSSEPVSGEVAAKKEAAIELGDRARIAIVGGGVVILKERD